MAAETACRAFSASLLNWEMNDIVTTQNVRAKLRVSWHKKAPVRIIMSTVTALSESVYFSVCEEEIVIIQDHLTGMCRTL